MSEPTRFITTNGHRPQPQQEQGSAVGRVAGTIVGWIILAVLLLCAVGVLACAAGLVWQGVDYVWHLR